MDKEVVSGVVRHILTALGGVLVSKGVIEAGQVEMLVGSLVGIIGVAWSIYAKKKA